MNAETLELRNNLFEKLQLGEASLTDLSYSERVALLKPAFFNPKNGDMVVETGHRTFDSQSNCISTGNVIANTMLSSYIRPYNEVKRWNGQNAKEGELQNYDLKQFRSHYGFKMVENYIKRLSPDETVIVYSFFHYCKGARIFHGFIITDENFAYKTSVCTGPTYKSHQVIDEVRKYVALEPKLLS